MKFRPKAYKHSDIVLHRPPEWIKKQLRELTTHVNPAWTTAKRFSPQALRYLDKTIRMHSERGEYFLLPRGFNPDQLGPLAQAYWAVLKWDDQRVSVPAVFPKFRLEFNKEQELLLSNFEKTKSKQLVPFGNYLYIAPTSMGKTFLQAEIASRLEQKTLVLFWTALIRKAWIDDLRKGYGIPACDVGWIQQKAWKIGPNYTLASIQTLGRRKERWDELFSNFGTVIFDEVDQIKAPTLFQFARACPCKNLIGATATRMLSGGNQFYLDSIFGKPLKTVHASQRDTETSLAVQSVKVVRTEFEYSYTRELLNFGDLLNTISLDYHRNEIIVREAMLEYKAGQSVLISTRRVAHASMLYSILREKLEEMGHSRHEAAIMMGETNMDRRRTDQLVRDLSARKVRLVVAVDKAVMRGANLHALSVLILAAPIADRSGIEQLLGRIRRRHTEKATCRMTYILDERVGYLNGLFGRVVCSVLRKLKVPGWERKYVA